MNRPRLAWTPPAALLALGLMMIGCGPKGPPQYEVSGKATFAGQPIPAGKIMFEPDATADNSGPLGLAMIKDGEYRTVAGKGAAGGPQVVRVYGFDGNPPPGWPGSQLGKPIFQPYEIKIELPKEPTTADFDVPARRE